MARSSRHYGNVEDNSCRSGSKGCWTGEVPEAGRKIAPCKTQRSKPQRRGKKQPVLVSEASSTGRASDQYCLTMVISTGSSCDQYWLLSPYRKSLSDSRATPLSPLHYTTPLFIGFADEARQVKAQTTTRSHTDEYCSKAE